MICHVLPYSRLTYYVNYACMDGTMYILILVSARDLQTKNTPARPWPEGSFESNPTVSRKKQTVSGIGGVVMRYSIRVGGLMQRTVQGA